MDDYWEYHTLTDTIIATLTCAKSTREFHRILRERAKKRYKRATVDSTVSRLKRMRHIEETISGWQLTDLGKKIREEERLLDIIPSRFKKDAPHNTIAAFDIPENERIKRTWLRDQLRAFGYKMMQKSLWMGPGPLPKEFMDRLKKLSIKERIKIFTVQK